MKMGAISPEAPEHRHPSRRATWIATIAAVGCIALQFGRRLDLAALSALLWLVTVALTDPVALRRLVLLRFWAITILFALLSGLLLGPRDHVLLGIPLSGRGLEAGALMICRGLFIFALVSWASRAIDGHAVNRLASRVGLGKLGVAVTTAFALLPALVDRLAERRRAMKHRRRGRRGEWRRSLVELVGEAVRLSDQLSLELAPRATLVVVTGGRGRGKTTTMARLTELLKKQGVDVGGIIQPALEGETQRVGYNLKDMTTGGERPLARRKATGHGYDFDELGWHWAAERLKIAHRSQQVVMVDELGLVEAQGGGHLVALGQLQRKPGRASLLVAAIRQDSLEAIAARLGTPALVIEAPAADEDINDVAAQIAQLIGESPPKRPMTREPLAAEGSG
jgi:nucleoside-triphosphatase THEP1